MQIYRVLDMKIEDDKELYLIQWLGNHRNSAQWLARQYIRRNHPKQLIHIDNFQRQFSQKCSEIRFNMNVPGIKQKPNTVIVKQEESNHLNYQVKVSSALESAQSLRKKGSMTLRRGSDRIMNKAKSLLEKQKSVMSFPSKDFKLSIFTDKKYQNHWVYKDYVDRIISKEPKQPKYEVIWNDGTKGQVTEEQLMQRECAKLCQFWENILGAALSKNIKT